MRAAASITVVIVQLGNTVPANTFQTVFSAKTPGGLVGASTSIANTRNVSFVRRAVESTFASHHAARVVVQESSESRTPANATDLFRPDGGTLDQFVGHALMIPFPVVGLHVLRNHPPEMAFAKWGSRS